MLYTLFSANLQKIINLRVQNKKNNFKKMLGGLSFSRLSMYPASFQSSLSSINLSVHKIPTINQNHVEGPTRLAILSGF